MWTLLLAQYCGLCMDFLSFLTTKLNPDLLAAHNVKLVVIGCGDPSMIKGCEFGCLSDSIRGAGY